LNSRILTTHVLSLPSSRPVSAAVQWTPEGGKRKRGRPTSDGCRLGRGQVCCRWPPRMEITRRPVFQWEQEDLSLSLSNV